MPSTKKTTLSALLLCAAVALSACQSSEERAEEHYQSALSLLEDGDSARAEVEFRNVLALNGTHRDARATYAQMLRDGGRQQQAFRQYLRLIEQYPRDAEGLIAVTELALLGGNLEIAQRHGAQAIEVAPDDDRITVIGLYLEYLDALQAEDALATEAVIAEVEIALVQASDSELLQRLSLDGNLRSGELDIGLARLDGLIENNPNDRSLYDMRIAILAELDRADDIEAQLMEMLDLFPLDEELPATILRFHLSLGETDDAIGFLRNRIEMSDDADEQIEVQTALVRLLMQIDGPDAALAELDQLLAAADAPSVFTAQRAAIRFDLGARDEAIAEMEALLDRGDLPSEEEGTLRVALAGMLLTIGNEVGARAQVEQVLEVDSTQTDALRMQAAWLITEDEADEAISVLRTVLDLSPDDADAMTLMSQAHSRNGNHELAREFLALAVEASGNAPAETVRYVTVLIEGEFFFAAEELLISALQQNPGQLELLNTLGRLYILMEDWPRAEQVESTLRQAGDPERDRAAGSLQVSRMAAQGQIEDAMSVLEGLASAGGASDTQTPIAVIRARLATGDSQGALAYARELVAENPAEPGFRFALAAVLVATGNFAEAEPLYRTLTEELPEEQQIWIALVRVLNLQGRDDEAQAVLATALEALPDALDLLWAQASYLEGAGDYEGAIAIYEEMYARVPNAEVIANNLASMLSTYRSDEASLDRAWTVARRLRGRDIPPFQDTYGWLAYLRGEYQVALEHLEPAVAGLPEDPLIRYHLGQTYVALNRPEDALEQLRLAIELAGPEDERQQFVTAREEIARIEAAQDPSE